MVPTTTAEMMTDFRIRGTAEPAGDDFFAPIIAHYRWVITLGKSRRSDPAHPAVGSRANPKRKEVEPTAAEATSSRREGQRPVS